MALAVSGMGSQITCVGLLGYPDLMPVFKPLAELGKVISIGQPGHTDALEFQDGKIMLGKLNTIKDMNWNRLMQVVGENAFRDLLLKSDCVACTNWTMLTEMEDVLNHIIAMVPTGSSTTFFFDLADPEKRERKDIEKVLEQISALNKRSRCILGLNLREAEQVIEILNLGAKPDETAAGTEAASVSIREKLGLHAVVVHAIKAAGACTAEERAGILGPYCPNPKLSTGAGDHFNGGFAAALLGGASVRDALYCGVGTSGWYVRNAKSPKLEDVVGLLQAWGAGRLND
jgi:pfkB family carbohydrate kinase